MGSSDRGLAAEAEGEESGGELAKAGAPDERPGAVAARGAEERAELASEDEDKEDAAEHFAFFFTGFPASTFSTYSGTV